MAIIHVECSNKTNLLATSRYSQFFCMQVANSASADTFVQKHCTNEGRSVKEQPADCTVESTHGCYIITIAS
jgi:hypothetical protein